MIKKKIGEKMFFTGGAEYTPLAEIGVFRCRGSLHNGEKNIIIRQNGGISVSLSVETMEAIIKWARKE